MEEAKIRFTGDDAEEAKEIFFGLFMFKGQHSLKKACEDNDIALSAIEVNGSIITVRTGQ